jgi:hypothetical protein
MHVVAIGAIAASVSADAEALARALGDGITALDVRMALAGTPPSVVLRTPSRERANEAARILAAAGLAVVAVELARVVPVERMVHVHRFAFDARGLHADTHLPAEPDAPVLAFDAIAVILRVAAETSVWRTTHEKEIASMRGRGVTVDVQYTRAERAAEQALFLYARGSNVPWVLRAGEARYLGLGAAMRPTAAENFATVIALLRERAPSATYDERFVAHPLLRHAEVHVRDNDPAAVDLGDRGVEVRVQLLAQMLGWSEAREA